MFFGASFAWSTVDVFLKGEHAPPKRCYGVFGKDTSFCLEATEKLTCKSFGNFDSTRYIGCWGYIRAGPLKGWQLDAKGTP